MRFIYESTLGWYAAQYFLFVRHHGQIEHPRELWKEDVYRDIEDFYNFYLLNEAGNDKQAQIAWEGDRLLRIDRH